MIKKVTLITTSHLASNPRLVKEAFALVETDFTVSIIFLQHIDYLEAFDNEIIKTLPKVKFYPVNYGTNTTAGRYLNCKRLLRKFWLYINPTSSFSENLFFPEFKKLVKKNQSDLFIGHTIGSLPIINWAAGQFRSKFAFDAEDYHREESTDQKQNKFAERIEDKYLLTSEYISVASPFIAGYYKKNYPTKKVITINNYFEYKDLNPINCVKKRLKLVWFSQTIGMNRGLKEFLLKVKNLDEYDYEIHLRGTCSIETKAELLSGLPLAWQKKIFFYPQCSTEKLFIWLQQFDIGLALETGFSKNNDIAISNKIFQYMNAGLAIVATPTTGQKWVMNQCPDAGFILNQDSDLINLKNWQEDRESLNFAKSASVLAATNTFNWKFEQEKLIETIKQIDLG